MEDKQKICDFLAPALIEMKECADLVDLEYIPDQEQVVLAFASGETRRIDVTVSSGIEMIQEIVGCLRW